MFSYILVFIGLAIGLWASYNVKSQFNKYSKIRSYSGMTAEQVVDVMLRAYNIHDVKIGKIAGNLTDHYDPKSKIIRLSDSVYGSNSIAAIGVAAHECGHAIQHATAYGPLALRSSMVPLVNISSAMSEILVMVGLLLGVIGLLDIGIFAFSIVILFYIVTLPVEFNASARATKFIQNCGYFSTDDVEYTKKVLSAAAMTYVASTLNAIIQLIRLLAIRNRDN